MLEESKRLAKRALDEVLGAGNRAAVDEIFHPDFINHESGSPHRGARDSR